jgi:hypothetical protein
MNNTKSLAAIAAIIFMAATLVVGAGTIAVTSTHSAFAYAKKKDNGERNDNGNTVTIQACNQDGSVSGFDNTEEQECQNLICTHPGNNATCSQETEGLALALASIPGAGSNGGGTSNGAQGSSSTSTICGPTGSCAAAAAASGASGGGPNGGGGGAAATCAVTGTACPGASAPGGAGGGP